MNTGYMVQVKLIKKMIFCFFMVNAVAFAGCPNINSNDLPINTTPSTTGVLENINGINNRGRILACKSDGLNDDTHLSIELTRENLTNVSTQESISLGNASLTAPLPVGSADIEISGGSPIADYALNNVGYSIIPVVAPPLTSKKVLWNFYLQCRRNDNLWSNCRNSRKEWLKKGLRANPGIFVVNDIPSEPSDIGNEVAKINNIILTHQTDNTKKIQANIKFVIDTSSYRTYTNSRNLWPQPFLYVGVYAEVQPIINPSDSLYRIQKSGEYIGHFRIKKNNFVNHKSNSWGYYY